MDITGFEKPKANIPVVGYKRSTLATPHVGVAQFGITNFGQRHRCQPNPIVQHNVEEKTPRSRTGQTTYQPDISCYRPKNVKAAAQKRRIVVKKTPASQKR